MRLMKFNAAAEHSPGKKMHVANALSRTPLPIQPGENDIAVLEQDVQAYVDMIEASCPANSRKT